MEAPQAEAQAQPNARVNKQTDSGAAHTDARMYHTHGGTIPNMCSTRAPARSDPYMADTPHADMYVPDIHVTKSSPSLRAWGGEWVTLTVTAGLRLLPLLE